jgi:hypothetical protein
MADRSFVTGSDMICLCKSPHSTKSKPFEASGLANGWQSVPEDSERQLSTGRGGALSP